MKYYKIFSIALIFFFSSVAHADFKLTINNNTNTGFIAKTVGGQFLGNVKKGQQGAVLNVPYLPFPKYAVSLVGNNGGNGAIINKGNGPFCSDQMTYHNCTFKNVSNYHATVTISN